MDSKRLVDLLEQVRAGTVAVPAAVNQLRHLPFEDLGFAKVDHHRALRQGFPEVIMGLGKQAKDIAAIVRAMRRRRNNILVTRLDAKKIADLKRLRSGLRFHVDAGAATWVDKPIKITGKGTVLIVCAGTSDIPVAEEAVPSAPMNGQPARKTDDVHGRRIHPLCGK